MIVIPAIDIKDGQVVRLLKGQVEQTTVYSDDPVAIAKKWQGCGAQWLHVVDLDAAMTGTQASQNFEVISRIATAVQIPIQLGGGIRNKYDIARYLSSGVSRIILGTKAVENREFLKEVLEEWKGQIVVSIDCMDGKVAHHGWKELSNIQAVDFAKELKGFGLECLIYTDISRDGTLSGPNVAGLTQILDSVNMSVIASGGIGSMEDIKALLELESRGLWGVITGKAIYEGKIDLREAINLCSPKE